MPGSFPIFKGATRPACIFGVPLKPFVVVSGAVLLLSFYVWMPLALLLVPLIWAMQSVTKSDDQKFRQLWLSLRFRCVAGANHRFWRGTTVLRAADYRRDRRRFFSW